MPALKSKRAQGLSIEKDLAGLKLSEAALDYLLRVHTLLDSNSEVFDAEWENVYSILVEAKKRQQFAAWRQEERERNITLGPDYFKSSETALTQYPPPQRAQLPPWRATLTDRLDWEDLLLARIEQEQAVKAAFAEAVSKAEEEALVLLRDALIRATNAQGTELPLKAKWLTDRLLIDMQVGPCQQTTRVSQAIETLQNLLWSVRTGQLYDTYPDLGATQEFQDYFDEEWQWIGSYATWRAAVMVFLYPENILMPHLRKHQTPAFRQLVKNLSTNRQLTP